MPIELPPHLQPRETPFAEGETYQRMQINRTCQNCGYFREDLLPQLNCEKCSTPHNIWIRSSLLARLVGRKKPYKPPILNTHREINRKS